MCFLVFFYILFLKYQYYLFHYVASHGLGLNKKGWRARTSKYWKLRREIEMSSRECYFIQQKDSCPWVGTHRQKRQRLRRVCVVFLSSSIALFAPIHTCESPCDSLHLSFSYSLHMIPNPHIIP